jgi:general secretion pathway protein C
MPIESIVKRYFPAVVMALVAAAAYFPARGFTQLVSTLLGMGTSAQQPTPRLSSSAPPEAKSGRDILERNPFDSAAGTLTPPRSSALSSSPSLAAADPLSWPECEGVQVLIVTESKDPWWSLTSLREPNEAQAKVRRVGDNVAGKRVAFIGYNSRQQVPAVWLEGRDEFCQARLFWEPSPLVQAPPDTERKLARSLVTKMVEEPALLRSVRVVPEQRDGKIVGLRLFGIRPSSLLGSLGLRNGDRLESINGFSVASPEKALEAYARLRSASRLSVHLDRAGRAVDLNLNIN